MSTVSKIELLMLSNTLDLRELAIILDCDPAHFYVGTDLSGANLKGQDLRGMNFDATNLFDADIDYNSKFDNDIMLKLNKIKIMRYLEISDELIARLDVLSRVLGYSSRGWLIKAICPIGSRSISNNPNYWLGVLSKTEFQKYFNTVQRSRIELKLGMLEYRVGQTFGRHFKGRSPGVTALIIVGILSDAIEMSRNEEIVDLDHAISIVTNGLSMKPTASDKKGSSTA